MGLAAQDPKLIDIRTIDQLNALRYDPDGNGMVADENQAAYDAAFVEVPRCVSVAQDGSKTTNCQGYELRNDLDFAGTKWENPTGGTYGGTRVEGGWEPIAGFDKTFDGNGYAIHNLYINRNEEKLGLFAQMGFSEPFQPPSREDGQIRNLGLENADIRTTHAEAKVGSLLGYLREGKVLRCYATVNMHTTGNENDAAVGGLIGEAHGGLVGEILACYTSGSIAGANSVGGVLGTSSNNSNTTVKKCYSTANIESTVASPPFPVGGLGGIVGTSQSSKGIENCYFAGSIDGKGQMSSVGGVVGVAGGEIKNCYSSGRITGTDNIPRLADFDRAAGAGGVAGHGYNSGITVTNSYFDKGTGNGVDRGRGIGHVRGNGKSSGADDSSADLGKTSLELQTPTSAEGIYSEWSTDDWDFGSDSRYPRLKVSFGRDGNSNATAVEFGEQAFYFANSDMSTEMGFNPVFEVEENTISGTIGHVKTISGTARFNLVDDNFMVNSTTGEMSVKLNAALDYESSRSLVLPVKATLASTTTYIAVRIRVTNVQAFFKTAATSFSFSVPANAPANAKVGLVVPHDRPPGALTYTLSGTGSGDFSIDANGSIQVMASSLTQGKSYTPLTVTVAETTASGQTIDNAEATVTITVGAADNTAPTITGGSFSFEVAENAAQGTLVGTIKATDAVSSVLSYTLSGAGSDNFSIGDDGIMRLSATASLNHSTTPSYPLTVTATDAAGNTSTPAATITITVIDKTPPVFTASSPFSVAEDAAAETVVGTVSATDPSTVASYAFSPPHNSLSIDNNGEIKVSSSARLDYETSPSHMLTVVATDSRGNAAEGTITITVTDADEYVPVFKFPTGKTFFRFEPAEGSGADTMVGTVSATDDFDMELEYSLAGNGASDFRITRDADGNGKVKVAPGVTLYYETRPVYTIEVTATDDKPADNSSSARLVIAIPRPAYAAPNNPRLIDIRTVEQLNAMRYDLDGNGLVADDNQAAYNEAFVEVPECISVAQDGSKTTNCQGYELRNDLNFAGTKWENPTGGTYADTRVEGGWEPIANLEKTFDGNGYIIHNLYINRNEEKIGLFAERKEQRNVEIRNLGLENAYIRTTHADAQVGALVGSLERGKVLRCYATVNIHTTGLGRDAAVGGLIGELFNTIGGEVSACYTSGSIAGANHVGGVVGNAFINNRATISKCYSTANIEITASAGRALSGTGGILGTSRGGSIANCYFAGSIDGKGKARYLGGIAGIPAASSEAIAIKNCYSSGRITRGNNFSTIRGSKGAGGIAGWRQNATALITTSYFDNETGGVDRGIGSEDNTASTALGKTSSDLKTPTSAGGIYSEWSADDWDFGTNSRYPRLKVSFGRDDNSDATSTEFGEQAFYFTNADMSTEMPFNPVFEVEENTISGTIGHVKTISGTARFNLVDDNFMVNSATGAISVKSNASLDYESSRSLVLPIKATVSKRSSIYIPVRISVMDVPTFKSGASFSFSVPANAPTDAKIGIVVPDDRPAAALTYALSGTDSGDFSINADGAVQVMASSLTQGKSYTLTLTATEAGGSAATASLNITVTEADNRAPTISGSPFSVSVPENISTTKEIITITATDDPSSLLDYALDNPNFSIDENGAVRVSTTAASLDHSTTPAYAVTVTVSDVAGNEATAMLTITVTAEDTTPPAITGGPFAFMLAKTANSGTPVGTITATDSGGGTLTYSLSGDNHTDFSINGSGMIQVDAASLDYETVILYRLTTTITDFIGNKATTAVRITVGVITPIPTPDTPIPTPDTPAPTPDTPAPTPDTPGNNGKIYFEVAELENRVTLSPNPASNKLQIHSLESNRVYMYEIYNLLAKRILSGQLPRGHLIDLGEISDGTYVFLLREKDQAEPLFRSRLLIRK